MTAALSDIGPFTWADAPHGRRDFIIHCSRCGGHETLVGQNYGMPTAASVLPKKFNQRGWRVGSKASKHICPACQQKTTDTNPAPHKEPSAMTLTREHVSTTRIPAPPVPPVPASIIPPPPTPLSQAASKVQTKAEPPREASIEERRIINAKLDDVYASKGYTAGWSDEAVAKDLNVPRAWVAQVREMLFGADINEDDVRALAACQAAINTVSQTRDEMQRFRREATEHMDSLIARASSAVADVRQLMTKLGR